MLIDELKLIIESIKKHIPKVISSFKLSDLENDLYEQPDWNQNDETALNYINNRTHYEESLLETIFDEEITVDTVYGGDGSEFIYYLPASVNLNLETGASYVITLGDQTEVGILDGAYLNTASWLFASSRRALRGANAGEYKVPFTKRFTLSKIGESIVHQLDEKFIPETIARVSKLPQSDWNQSDETTTDYVKNRTHYTGLVDGNILVDNLNSADYENGVSIPQCRIIPGNTYKVIWNGDNGEVVIIYHGFDEEQFKDNCLHLDRESVCVSSLNATFTHKLYDYSHLPEYTFGQRLKKLRLLKGLSQYELGNQIGMQHSMIGSYERDEFYPTLESIKKLGKVLNTSILCSEGYSKFLLNSSTFKDKLFKWRIENNLTKRSAAKLLGISERGYALWEDGVIMSVDSYYKIKCNLLRYNLI